MRVCFKGQSPAELDHELIWGAIGSVVGLAVMVFPVEGLGYRCAFKALTGWPCPTCGMTRSLVHLRHLEFGAAFVSNPLIAAFALFAAAFCAYAWIAVLFRTRRIRIATTRAWEPTMIRALTAGALVCNWIYVILAGR